MDAPPLYLAGLSRLRAANVNKRTTVDPTELTAALAEEKYHLIDRTVDVPVSSQDFGKVMKFLHSTTTNPDVCAGRAIVFALRTVENSDGFNTLFVLSKFSHQFLAGSDEPIHFVAPGWLAWCRDDYFFAAPDYDLKLSTRVLLSFARGVSDCCICLEPVYDEAGKCVTGLSCGHVIHTDCLQHCWQQALRAGKESVCPLCREPFFVAADGMLTTTRSTTTPDNAPGWVIDVPDSLLGRDRVPPETSMAASGSCMCCHCTVL
mmetsp:Transcript_33675/g.55615  ORF Transcript_33675/g.55615 Transcript_33675/m.55615 type:complete len:262 (-) Transcript_33675:60-845(-)